MSAVESPWSRQLKPVMQSEAADCGLACLTMIAAFHGHRVNLGGLRQRYPTSIKGATLADLMRVGSDLGLSPRAVRLELDEISQLQTPAILHWDLNHFVVLEKVTGKGVTILDPARGRRNVSADELDRHFTGVALELSPVSDFTAVQAHSRTRISDLWSRLVNYRGAATQVLALSVLLQMTALLVPFFLQLTVDEAIGQSDRSLMVLLLVGFAAIYALSGVIKALRSWVVLTLGQSLSYQLGGNVVRHLLRLPLGFFERRHVGDLLSRIGSVQPIQSLLTQGVVNVVIDSILAITTIVVMALVSPFLMLLVLVSTAIYIGYGLLLLPGLRSRSEEEIIARAEEETFLMETLRAMRAIKLHGHEALRENGWRNRFSEVISAGYRTNIYDIKLSLGESLLFNAQLLLTVYFGALAVMDQNLTIGLLMAFLSYRMSFVSSATSLVSQWQKWRLVGLHLERLTDIVGQAPEEIALQPRPSSRAAPSIRLDGLGFSYTQTEAPIFHDLTLDVPPGAFIAIVGPSGTGKTTLMRVLLGLLPPSNGRIAIDGAPLGPATYGSWRGRIGAVLQDDVLLTGTLADNIAFFDAKLDQDQVEVAAKLARIHDDIMNMPMGYQSLVGDMGAALSGGQRQRILLARALYRDPDALFLDEGTANLDEDNEAAIADMIRLLPITRIVISHRPALIERADIVYRLDKGIIEQVARPRTQSPVMRRI
jgi:ATP-binding cassette subfamily B protein RaxB